MNSRHDRQIPFFTKEGQARLERLTVAVVGVGGLGSHVVQQLAFLGVGHVSLVDDQTIELSNLNRLVYATPADENRPKVEVAQEFLRRISPSMSVTALRNELRQRAVLEELRKADFVFGCVDHDGPRFVLSKFCAVLGKRYADLATEIARDRTSYGGRVVNLEPGKGCLACWPEGLDQDEVRDYLDSPEGRRFRADIYGQQATGTEASGPSVVSLNGVVASLAVTEFLLPIAGIRASRRVVQYRGESGVVTNPRYEGWDPSVCRICATLAGSRRNDELEGLLLN